MTRFRTALTALLIVGSAGCGLFRGEAPRPPQPPEGSPVPGESPAPEASPAPQETAAPSVMKAAEPVIVRAWAEPRLLPPAGGQAQLLVLARKRNGDPFAGVEVRFQASEGSLFSGGRILTTDDAGRTRDRLTTRQSSVVTVDVGGTTREIQVTVAGGR
jgi:hypothetical protein